MNNREREVGLERQSSEGGKGEESKGEMKGGRKIQRERVCY